MRKVILQIDVTIDGFAADRSGNVYWAGDDDAMTRDAHDLLATADTILLGRVAYEDFVQFWPTADTSGDTTFSKIAAQINQATKLVFSRSLESASWGTWNNARVVKGDLVEEVTRLKAEPGKNLLLYAGATIVDAFTQHNLIDDYYLRVHPVVAGKGLRLFDGLDQTQMTLVQAKSYNNGVVVTHYTREK
jgi:dihydrofolate reductase